MLPLAFRAPFALRKWLYWEPLLRSPRRIKETMGTVMVTSVPVASRSGGGGWGIPIARFLKRLIHLMETAFELE